MSFIERGLAGRPETGSLFDRKIEEPADFSGEAFDGEAPLFVENSAPFTPSEITPPTPASDLDHIAVKSLAVGTPEASKPLETEECEENQNS